MGFKSNLVYPFAHLVSRKINRESRNAIAIQENIFREIIFQAKETLFGKDHGFQSIRNYHDFKKSVPVKDYESLKPYFELIKEGKPDITWKGKPVYLTKTSGTTSGIKYIPITKASAPHHMNAARNMAFHYMARTGNRSWMDGKMIFLSGSPKLTDTNGIPTGRLSGIVNHMIPSWLKTNRLPSFETNSIEDWEKKLDRIVEETMNRKMTMISGIPPWVQMYYERLLDATGKKTISEIFPHYSLFVYGGVNYEPYRAKLEQLVGKPIDSLETYPASEGFIAFQDIPGENGMLLNINGGIFYEFIPSEQIFNDNPDRLSLKEVETGVNYALILNSNAGLWGYNIGDTIEFLSTDPPRIRVTGRVKHFISAFGEHVISKEVEHAMMEATKANGTRIIEFTVAPEVTPKDGLAPYHEWFVEFDKFDGDLAAVAKQLDQLMTVQNIYYKDLIDGNILRPLKLTMVQKDGFRNYMKSLGKLGGQNKVPRLANDRKIVEQLKPWLENCGQKQ